MCRFEGRASFGCSGRKPCSGLGQSRRRRRLWAPHTFLEASSFEAFDLFSHTPGETLAPVLGADDGGAPVSRSFVEASFWSGLGLGESSARVVRGLGAGVEVGAAAPGISFVWWLALVARATWSSTRWVRGFGA